MPFPQLDTFAQNNFNADFPSEDSQYFSDMPIDPSMKKETDGGLVFTRRQYTRDPGRHIVTGFTSLDNKYKQILDFFYRQMGGGSDAFDYVHPLDNVTLRVRFEDPYNATYKGIGSYKVWDVTQIKLRTI